MTGRFPRVRQVGSQVRETAGGVRQWLAGGPETWVPTEDEVEFLQGTADSAGSVIRVRPRSDENEIIDGREVLPAFHVVQTDLLKRNQSQTHAFELWGNDGAVECAYVPGEQHMADRVEGQLTSQYRDAEVTRSRPRLPVLESGQHIAAISLSLGRELFYPIRRHDVEGFEIDPFRPLITEILGPDTASQVDALVQVVFKPAKGNWTTGGWFGGNVADAAEYLRTPEVKGWLSTYEVDPSKTERRAAEVVQSQRGSDAFHTDIRVLVSAESRFAATNRVWEIARVFEQYFDSMIGQGFQITQHRGSDIEHAIESAVARQLMDAEMVLTVDELAGVAHIPAASLMTPPLDWTDMTPYDQLPSNAETFAQEDESP
ncbi:hypothetical protein [Halorussus salinisoli]|uniref:hypothetical protein n=1 Tax=Halorussus salinisoli TaxID=2558242 RepID=UPI0010C1FAB8|nr:hypothetical protein [Halorussus salinisoli]